MVRHLVVVALLLTASFVAAMPVASADECCPVPNPAYLARTILCRLFCPILEDGDGGSQTLLA